ncbi:MAG: T9SS type A sorting domain-containing protein [Ignavibacteriaceae bacterium]|nr:T9SS type A sorting domain-containing protein [Ignavibacteriaceae bacterium]
MKKLNSSSLLIIFIFLQINVHSAIRYVKAGNPTPIPPYTSWATASDSIQKCINVCVPGDTIYLSEGVFEEQVFMIPGLAIIGSGMLTTIIDCSEVAPWQGATRVVYMQDSCKISDLTLKIRRYIPEIVGGISARDLIKININNIYFDATRYGVSASDAKVYNCIFYWSGTTMTSASIEQPYQINFYNNYLIGVGDYAYLSGNTNGQPCKVDLHNNVISLKRYAQIMDNGWSSLFTTYFRNNIVLGYENQEHIVRPLGTISKNTEITNNLFYINHEYGFNIYGNCKMHNNIFYKIPKLFREAGDGLSFRYNALWQSDIRGWYDSTNIIAYPMVYKMTGIPEQVDGRLQKYSPLIDAGNPGILDPDSSRSDIGPAGGVYGMIYEYADLPPVVPENVTLKANDTLRTLEIKWNPNYEVDFRSYYLYKDTVDNFIADSTKLLLETADTCAILPVPFNGFGQAFYRLRSVDSQGNLSEAGKTVGYVVTGVDGNEPGSNENKLYDIYPNPTAGKIVIPYRIKEESKVRIVIFDIKGEVIEKTEVEKPGGYYEYEYAIREKEKASGIYIVLLEIHNPEKGILIYSEVKKAVLLK